MKKNLLLLLLLIIQTVAVYYQVGDHEFLHWDDNVYITSNPRVTSGLSGENLLWAFTSTHAANWHPLTWVSHMVDWDLFGENPRGHHYMSLVFHIANACLVFIFLDLCTASRWKSYVIASLFALHPTHIESVAWIAERKDVLSVFFGMLALIFYYFYAVRGRTPFYILTLALFVFSLMSKPMLVTLPAVMLLLDYWPLKRCESLTRPFQALSKFGDWRAYRSRNSLILEKMPFLILSLLSGIVTVYAQHKGQAVSNLVVLPFGKRLGNAVNSYFDYLLKQFWPDHLAAFYPYPDSIDFGATTFELIVLAAIFFAALKYARKYPFVIVGWLWFVITLLPVIGILQVGRQAMADRYTYFPSIGVFMIVAFGAPILVARFTKHRHLLAVAATCAIMACMYVSWKELAYWKTSFSLFSHALQITPKNAVAHLVLATAFSKSSRPDEAMYHYSEASRFDRSDAEAYNGMGWQYYVKGQPEEAVLLFQKALKLKPDGDRYHLNLGVAYEQTGESELAIQHYREAVRLGPDNLSARKNLRLKTDELSSPSFRPESYPADPDTAEEISRFFKAAVRKSMAGNFDEAAHYYRRIIALNPKDARAYYYLGILHIFQKRIGEAISCFKEAVKLNPEFYESHYNLAVASGIIGDREGFFTYLDQCLRIKPDYYMAHNQLGLYFLKQGEIGKAIDHFRKALDYFPEYDEAHNNLAIALVQSGKKQEGLLHFRRALQINPEHAEAKRNIEVYGKK